MEQKEWIEKVMQSMDNTKEVQPDTALFEQLELKIKESKVTIISMPTVIGIAASLLLLITLNINSLKNLKTSSPTEINDLIEELNIQESNQLYN